MQDAKVDTLGTEFSRLVRALEAVGEIAYEWNFQTDQLTWLAGVQSLFGHDVPDIIHHGAGFATLIHGEDASHRADTLSRHQFGGAPYDCEYRVVTPDGVCHWVHDQGSAEFTPSGEPSVLRGALRVINERKRSEARFSYLANYDELTGHYNRARLRDSLESALYYGDRYNVSGAFLVVGIDKLTPINEGFGHEVADAVIVAIGKRLGQCLRVSDSIGRLSGDRFGVVLGNCPRPKLQSAADKILQAVRDTVVNTPAGPIHTTVSIGVMPFANGDLTASDTIAKAEVALLWAKQNGRDCVVVYSDREAAKDYHREHIVIAEKVQRALQDDRLIFAFQPIVDAKSHVPGHYECLLRMVSPEGEVMAAGRFMPVVEKLGMIRLIDLKVLEMAVQELARHPDARLAINVSGLSVTNRSWLAIAEELLHGHPALAKRLTVEITETTALEDFAECGRFVHALHDLGCKVALDDFGAGYTSFRHLKTLAVDMVKIDGSFIRNIDHASDNLVFVRTLLGLANSFNLVTVAECVERSEEAELLAREGVMLLQGYAFGAPALERPWAPDRASDTAIARTSRFARGQPAPVR